MVGCEKVKNVVDDTRTRLIESALRLLREEGLDAVTLRAVGDLTGLSRTAPYRHFTDKTALLAALAERVVGALNTHVADAVRGNTGHRDRLRALYLGYVEYAIAHPEEYRLVFSTKFLADCHPGLQEAIDQGMELLLSVTDARSTPKAAMMALLATAHGLAELAVAGHLTRKGLDYTEVIDALLPM